MKICPKCNQANEFYINNARKDGLTYACIACQKSYYTKNKEHIAQRSKEYNIKNREHKNAQSRQHFANNKELYKIRTEAYRSNNRAKMLLANAKRRALTLGKECNITIEDIIIPTKCPYLNKPITNIIGKGNVPTNPTVDRIDNTKGYIKGNVRVVSMQANFMKNKATVEQLIIFAKNVLKLHPINKGV